MSDVKRYEFMSDGYSARFLDPKTGHAAPKGKYVTLEDYARLKAEVKRLRIAGDEMANAILPFDWDDEVRRWNEAKEGKQS